MFEWLSHLWRLVAVACCKRLSQKNYVQQPSKTNTNLRTAHGRDSPITNKTSKSWTSQLQIPSKCFRPNADPPASGGTVQTVRRQNVCAEVWTRYQCNPCGTAGGYIWPGFGYITLISSCGIIPCGTRGQLHTMGKVTVRDYLRVFSLHSLAAM